MTCSSNTISSPDAPLRRVPGALKCGWAVVLALLASTPLPANPAPGAAAFVEQARADIAREDGIAAEVRLNRALAAGHPRASVAALMGQALLLRGLPGRARKWLEAGQFDPATAALGFRMLGRLEQAQGNLPAAARAYDRALARTPRDALLWVDIGRMRYAGGEDDLAVAASAHAVALDPANVRALEFRGQVVRDQFGLTAGLPWFEAGLARAPDDVALLAEYAATLGELGRAREMLAITRRILEIQPRNGRAFYLQAVLAARGGKTDVARTMLARAGRTMGEMPGALLLHGVLELRAGNPLLAVDALERLLRLQPANAKARTLLARALLAAGDHGALMAGFAADAARPGASPYLLAVLGRSYERIGRRDLAAPLLDRAGQGNPPAAYPLAGSGDAGALLAAGQVARAADAVARQLGAWPRETDFQAQAGDAALAAGDPGGALGHYRSAAAVRLSDSLLLRVITAMTAAGQQAAARPLLEGYLVHTPSSTVAASLAATAAVQDEDWPRAGLLLENLARRGGAQDANLMVALALARLYAGDAAAAERTAAAAYRLQPGNPQAAQAWAMALVETGARPRDAVALLAKARKLGGDNPVLRETLDRLANP